MKKTIKMHRLMFFTLLKPYLLLGIYPSLYSILRLLNLSTIFRFYYSPILLFLLLSGLIEIRRKSFKIELFKNYLIFKKGLYFKFEVRLSKEKIAAIYVKQNLIERLFSAKTVFVNTLSDSKKNCEIKFVVSKGDAKTIEDFVKGKATSRERKIPLLKVMLWAAVSGGAFEGILLFTPIIRNASRALGIKLFDEVLPKIADNLRFTDKYLSATVNTVTAAIIFIYFVGFLYEFLKNSNMRIKFSKNSFSVKSGIIVKRKTILCPEKMSGFCAEQTLLLRILRRQGLKAVTGGYLGRFSGAALVLPLLNDGELHQSLEVLLSCYNLKKECIAKKKPRFGAFSALLLPIFISLILIVSAIVLVLLFDEAKRFIIFALIGGLILELVYGYILLYGYKKSQISFEKNITAEGTSKFKIKRLFLKSGGIATIKLRQNPFDRKRGSCRATITPYSKNKEKTTVRWIDKSELMKSLENIE